MFKVPSNPYFSLKIVKLRKKTRRTVGVYSFLGQEFLVAITSTKRPPGARFEMKKRLKLSLKGVKRSFKKVDSYACAIRAKEEYFKRWRTVGHKRDI